MTATTTYQQQPYYSSTLGPSKAMMGRSPQMGTSSTSYQRIPQQYNTTASYATYNPGSYQQQQQYTTYQGQQQGSTIQQQGSTIQYTSEQSQRYIPSGCQPVAAFPHGISTIYSTGLVPAFMASPEVRITPANLSRWGVVAQEAATRIV